MTLLYACDGPGNDANGCKVTAPAEGKSRTMPRSWACALEERNGVVVMLDMCETCEKRRRAAREKRQCDLIID